MQDDDDDEANTIGAVRYPCMPSLVALQQMKNRLHLAYLGRKLMKWATLASGRELRRLALELEAFYKGFAEEMKNAYIMIARCRFFYPNLNTMVIEDIEKKAGVVVTRVTKNISSVKVIELSAVETEYPPYKHLGIDKGGQTIKETKETWLRLLKKLILLLKLRNQFAAVEAHHKAATKKWNILSKVIVPRIMVSCRYINSELEEIDREDNFRLKRFKELKTKKRKKDAELSGDKEAHNQQKSQNNDFQIPRVDIVAHMENIDKPRLYGIDIPCTDFINKTFADIKESSGDTIICDDRSVCQQISVKSAKASICTLCSTSNKIKQETKETETTVKKGISGDIKDGSVYSVCKDVSTLENKPCSEKSVSCAGNCGLSCICENKKVTTPKDADDGMEDDYMFPLYGYMTERKQVSDEYSVCKAAKKIEYEPSSESYKICCKESKTSHTSSGAKKTTRKKKNADDINEENLCSQCKSMLERKQSSQKCKLCGKTTQLYGTSDETSSRSASCEKKADSMNGDSKCSVCNKKKDSARSPQQKISHNEMNIKKAGSRVTIASKVSEKNVDEEMKYSQISDDLGKVATKIKEIIKLINGHNSQHLISKELEDLACACSKVNAKISGPKKSTKPQYKSDNIETTIKKIIKVTRLPNTPSKVKEEKKIVTIKTEMRICSSSDLIRNNSNHEFSTNARKSKSADFGKYDQSCKPNMHKCHPAEKIYSPKVNIKNSESCVSVSSRGSSKSCQALIPTPCDSLVKSDISEEIVEKTQSICSRSCGSTTSNNYNKSLGTNNSTCSQSLKNKPSEDKVCKLKIIAKGDGLEHNKERAIIISSSIMKALTKLLEYSQGCSCRNTQSQTDKSKICSESKNKMNKISSTSSCFSITSKNSEKLSYFGDKKQSSKHGVCVKCKLTPTQSPENLSDGSRSILLETEPSCSCKESKSQTESCNVSRTQSKFPSMQNTPKKHSCIPESHNCPKKCCTKSVDPSQSRSPCDIPSSKNTPPKNLVSMSYTPCSCGFDTDSMTVNKSVCSCKPQPHNICEKIDAATNTRRSTKYDVRPLCMFRKCNKEQYCSLSHSEGYVRQNYDGQSRKQISKSCSCHI